MGDDECAHAPQVRCYLDEKEEFCTNLDEMVESVPGGEGGDGLRRQRQKDLSP